MISLNTKNNLNFRGAGEVKYTYVICRDERMALMVTLSGAPAKVTRNFIMVHGSNARMEKFMRLNNSIRSYPIEMLKITFHDYSTGLVPKRG